MSADVWRQKTESHSGGRQFDPDQLHQFSKQKSRGAAKEAFATFLSGKVMNANQIEFVNMIVDHLTENDAMDPVLLYSSPYTDFSPRGVDGLFDSTDAAQIVSILRSVSKTAAA
ncbi:MAG TPA: type I restriction-modification enzyme R subunit C-terminal domain-containing protein [Thermoanaerobaculia bacterium]